MGDADVIDVVSRADAKAIGLSKYFTGEPCLRGHVSTRNTKSGLPLASFSFTSQDDPDLKVAWGLPNLRPLWAEDNLAKRDRVESLL